MISASSPDRYSRHLLLRGFGDEGQERLLNSKVLIAGAGGLGSPCALYLAAAGVGTIGVADGDLVSLSNLQRQIIHATEDVGRNKAASAAEKMQRANADIQLRTYEQFLTEDNILDVIAPYDFVLDCTDSYASKYLINDACVMAGKAFCCGGVVEYAGQLMTHVPGAACYRCLFPEPPAERHLQTCSTVGVLGPAVGIMGSMQAAEALKFLTGIGELLTNQLLVFDSLDMTFQKFAVARDASCSLCGSDPTVTQLREYSFQPCRGRS